MVLRVGDLRELKVQLLEKGVLGSIAPEELIGEATSWFEQRRPLELLDHQTFAYLCNCIRQEDHPEVQGIACGAIRLVGENLEQNPEKAQFIAQFAVDALSSLSGVGRGWNRFLVSDAVYDEALELFEVAKGDDTFSDERLISSTQSFISKYEAAKDLFGRLADDLSRLLALLQNTDSSDVEREIARAALTYFVEDSDAIPDHLGPVGFLDDAVVVDYALRQVFPQRSVVGSYLDATVMRWPFLIDVALAATDRSLPLSEYSIVNAALMLNAAQEGRGEESVALIVPDCGPLPYLLGFLTALGNLSEALRTESKIHYSVGDRLVDRTTHVEYLFDGYLDESCVVCEAKDAVYFAVIQPLRKGREPKYKNRGKRPSDPRTIKPISHLAALQPSARTTKTLQSGRQPIDIESTEVGAIERLFGSTEPLAIPPGVGMVVVVSMFKESESFARTMSLYRTPLVDVICSGVARCEDEIEFSSWTMEGPGGDQLLTVVRTTADAIELVEDPTLEVRAVVAPIRSDTTDVENLRRVSQAGVPVLGLLEEGDQESQRLLREEGFKFWTWDDEWLQHLHWPSSHVQSSSNPVSRYENRVRLASESSVDVHRLPFAPIDSLSEELKNLEALVKASEDEALRAMYDEAFVAFISLVRNLDTRADTRIIERVRTHIEASRRRWPDRVIVEVGSMLSRLEETAQAMSKENPKENFVQHWAAENPHGVVVAPSSSKGDVLDESVMSAVQWTPSIRDRFVSNPVLVPCWLSQKRMERLLYPPASVRVTLSLYAPEMEWYESLRQRRSRNRTRLRRLSRRSSAIPQASKLPAPKEQIEEATEPPPAVDQLLSDYRRRRVLTFVQEAHGEPVEARLVFFSGGFWAAFAPNACIHTFTHLLDSELESELPMRAVVDLVPGDRVLMVKGSERDAVAHAADKYLSGDMRTTAKLWQTALRQHFESCGTLKELRDQLAARGCERTTQTVRGWVHDDSRIGPSEPIEETLVAIQEVTRKTYLADNLKDCAEAIRAVRSAHIRAGRDLQERVLERVKEWLGAEVSPDDLIQVEEQVLLLTVEGVDADTVMVPRASLNQLKEDA